MSYLFSLFATRLWFCLSRRRGCHGPGAATQQHAAQLLSQAKLLWSQWCKQQALTLHGSRGWESAITVPAGPVLGGPSLACRRLWLSPPMGTKLWGPLFFYGDDSRAGRYPHDLLCS